MFWAIILYKIKIMIFSKWLSIIQECSLSCNEEATVVLGYFTKYNTWLWYVAFFHSWGFMVYSYYTLDTQQYWLCKNLMYHIPIQGSPTFHNGAIKMVSHFQRSINAWPIILMKNKSKSLLWWLYIPIIY